MAITLVRLTPFPQEVEVYIEVGLEIFTVFLRKKKYIILSLNIYSSFPLHAH